MGWVDTFAIYPKVRLFQYILALSPEAGESNMQPPILFWARLFWPALSQSIMSPIHTLAFYLDSDKPSPHCRTLFFPIFFQSSPPYSVFKQIRAKPHWFSAHPLTAFWARMAYSTPFQSHLSYKCPIHTLAHCPKLSHCHTPEIYSGPYGSSPETFTLTWAIYVQCTFSHCILSHMGPVQKHAL